MSVYSIWAVDSSETHFNVLYQIQELMASISACKLSTSRKRKALVSIIMMSPMMMPGGFLSCPKPTNENKLG